MSGILFFSDEVDFTLENENEVVSWIYNLAETEKISIESVNVIFTNDENLLKINKEFLNHDFYTDIVTFQNESDGLSGEIYISIDRVNENARERKIPMVDELHRVICHGFLHMTGLGDKTEEEKKEMRVREEFYLNLRDF